MQTEIDVCESGEAAENITVVGMSGTLFGARRIAEEKGARLIVHCARTFATNETYLVARGGRKGRA